MPIGETRTLKQPLKSHVWSVKPVTATLELQRTTIRKRRRNRWIEPKQQATNSSNSSRHWKSSLVDCPSILDECIERQPQSLWKTGSTVWCTGCLIHRYYSRSSEISCLMPENSTRLAICQSNDSSVQSSGRSIEQSNSNLQSKFKWNDQIQTAFWKLVVTGTRIDCSATI